MSKCGNKIHPQEPPPSNETPQNSMIFPPQACTWKFPIRPSLSACIEVWITTLKVELAPLFLPGGSPQNAYIMDMSLGPPWLPWLKLFSVFLLPPFCIRKGYSYHRSKGCLPRSLWLLRRQLQQAGMLPPQIWSLGIPNCLVC